MRFPASLTHPFGLALLVASFVIALVIALATDSPYRAFWVLLWGLLAYAACVLVPVGRKREAPTLARAPEIDGEPVDFVRLLEESLRHLNDHGALATTRLTRSIPLTLLAARGPSTGGREATPLEQAQALHEVLLGAIQKLRPADEEDPGSREALEYTVLYEEYVLKRPNKAIMTRLGIGERTFFRYRRAGIAAIARELTAQEQSLAGHRSL